MLPLRARRTGSRGVRAILFAAALAFQIGPPEALPGQVPAPRPPAAEPAIPPPLDMIHVAPADELVRYMPRSDFHAETRGNLRWVRLGRQRWLNYGFYKKDKTSLKPDWPVSIIFYGNASLEKVKRIFGKATLATNKYVFYDEGRGMVWDADKGVKRRVIFDGPDGHDRDVLHVRVFAPPVGYFEGEGEWGRYVIATTHFDFNPPFDNKCGYSEDAEREALRIAESRGYLVFPHCVDLKNTQKLRSRRLYYWQSDGFAALVRIP